jgi:hypothetical protein
MALRRGFKSEANWYSREMRKELGILPHGKMCPWKLAEHLECKLITLTSLFSTAPSAVAYFLNGASNQFSAAALEGGIIVHNDSHSHKRQASNIAHEIAHKLLIHRPLPLADLNCQRIFDPVCEEEANWLGPALLISEEAALHIANQGISITQASDLYGATEEVVRMRLNVSGTFKRIARRRVA